MLTNAPTAIINHGFMVIDEYVYPLCFITNMCFFFFFTTNNTQMRALVRKRVSYTARTAILILKVIMHLPYVLFRFRGWPRLLDLLSSSFGCHTDTNICVIATSALQLALACGSASTPLRAGSVALCLLSRNADWLTHSSRQYSAIETVQCSASALVHTVKILLDRTLRICQPYLDRLIYVLGY